MKDRSNITGQSMKALAAAVLLALGSSAAVAQQPGDQPGQEPGAQPGQQEPGAQQPGAQQPGEQPGAQQPGQQPGAQQPGAQQPGEQPGAQPGQMPGDEPGEQPEWQDDDDDFDRPGAFEDEEDRDVAAADRPFDDERGAEELDRISEEHPNLSRFVEAVKTAGMEDSLMDGRYTVFAPSDEAFEQLELEIERENWEQVAELLRAHIVADDVDSEMARRIGQALTLDGGQVELREQDGELMVGDARVTEEDIQVGNLRVYVIDELLSEGRPDTQIALGEEEDDTEIGIGERDDDEDETQIAVGDEEDDFGG